MAKRDRNRMRVLRAEKRLTQIDAARKAKMGLSRFWKIENGYIVPEVVDQVRIARALGVPVSEAFPEQVSA